MWLEELEGRIAPAVITPFTARFSANDTGDILFAANTLMTAPASDPGAAAAQAGIGTALNNNNFSMVYVDVDSDPTTFNSSRADLHLPVGATVLFAGLYWGADSSSELRTQSLLQTPTSNGYLPIKGALVGANGGDYQSFADVTSLVQNAGSGTYGVANVQASTGSDKQAGWALVVAFRDPAAPPRNLTVFDGFAVVRSSPTPDRNVDIPISGFQTPLAGPVNAKIGVVAYEGDRGSTGDTLRLNGTALSDSQNPRDNFFNSSISYLGQAVNTKSPNYLNQLGFDADIVQAPAGAIPNGATNATVTLNTGGETYFPGVVTTAIDLFAPKLQSTKTVTDLNGGFALQGDILEYSVTVENTGGDIAANVFLTDAIPANTTYIPGSLQIVSGANSGAKSDGEGDDQAEFDAVNNRVAFRLGAGASFASGGTLAIGETTTIRFRVQINQNAPNSIMIANQAAITATGATGNFTVTSSSTEAQVVIPPAADLVVTKSVDNPTPNAGDVSTFTVTLTNNGPTGSTGVQVSDPLPAGLEFVEATPSQGTYDSATGLWDVGALANGQVVTLVLKARTTTFAVVSNVATVTASDVPDPDPSNNSASTSVSPQVTDLAITKTVDNPTPNAGEIVTFTITLTNNGPVDSTGVKVSDPLLPGLEFVGATPSQGTYDSATGLWDVGALANGQVVTLVLQARTTFAVVSNVATVTASDVPDPDLSNNSASTSVSPQATDLAITKSVDNPTPNAGEVLTFTVTLTNKGPVGSTGIQVSDPLPAGLEFVGATPSQGTYNSVTGLWDVGVLANGQVVTLVLQARVTTFAVVSNVASVTASAVPDPDSSNNSASTSVSPRVTDLAITKTVNNPAPFLGDNVVFTLSVLNNGPSAATGVVVQDLLPAGLTFVSASGNGTYDPTTGQWFIGNLALGASTQLLITAWVTSLASEQNVAVIQKLDQFDIVPNNNLASIGVNPQAPLVADLEVVKTIDDPTPTLGDMITITDTLTNNGPSAATGVVVQDMLPDGLTLISAQPSVGTYDPASGLWSIPELSGGQSVTLTITALVTSPGTLNSVVTVTQSDQSDPIASNNVAVVTVTVAAPIPPPVVVSLVRQGVHAQPTQLVLGFSEALDAARAEELSQYRLVLIAHGGRLRRPVALRNASYDAVTHTVTLHPTRLLPLRWQYSLTVRGDSPQGLTSATGVFLDGNRDGVPGGNYSQTFGREILTRSNRRGHLLGTAGGHRMRPGFARPK
ncbi:hypothetical protein [Singulisphaera acidiphila]|uniref:hypothetical protein n=1 Tax=Singulisphaera acidiphila TaxID=466153 RepID=UPI00031512EC|nr:hypothetical protein [Singulisphaera acidiphila]